MQLEDYKLGGIFDWSSLIFIRVHADAPGAENCGKEVRRIPRGYIFVIDRKFGPRAQWKLPAGHKKKDETPLETAVRELLGETNLALEPAAFRYQGKWLGSRGNHWKCLFCVDIHERETGWMGSGHSENEGEEPGFFTAEQFHELVREGKFLDEHYRNLERLALVLPPPAMLRSGAAR